MVVQFFHIYLFISMYNKNQSFGIALCTKKVVPVCLFFSLLCILLHVLCWGEGGLIREREGHLTEVLICWGADYI